MSRLGITYDDVAHAATFIENSGDMPTIDKVRAHLGGTGSYTTISKHLTAWRQKIIPITLKNNERVATPDIVKAAVDRVWEEMRDQADTEIEAIKNEAIETVTQADKRALAAQERFNELQNQHQALTDTHHALAAAKEILQLDYKQLKDEMALLIERNKALEERCVDLQTLSNAHIQDLDRAHQAELVRLNEETQKYIVSSNNLIGEIKSQAEEERKQHMIALDSLKTEAHKQKKLQVELETQLKDQMVNTAELETRLVTALRDREEALAQLATTDARWTSIADKTLVSDHIASKLSSLQDADVLVERINTYLSQAMDNQLIEMKEALKLVAQTKEVENKDEASDIDKQ